MDQDIRGALADIKSDVRDGFAKIDQRIDQMVTKGEFVAEVRRLDAQHATLRRDFDHHDQEAPSYRKAAADKAEAVRAEVRVDLEGFRTTTRWAIALAATGAGVVVALLSWVINILK